MKWSTDDRVNDMLNKHRKREANPIEPNHYTEMKISPLEFIEANEDVLTWCTKNVIKYVGRYQRKNGLEDLKKAQWYLNHEIERLEKESK